MSGGNTPPKITISVSGTSANPYPPGLSDGVLSLPVGGSGDEDFTTKVVTGQTIQFVGVAPVVLTSIVEGEGSDIFKTDPTPGNKFTGVIGALLSTDTRDYTINYTVDGVSYSQDPKLQMK